MPSYVVLGCVCLERFREDRKFRREKWRNNILSGCFVWLGEGGKISGRAQVFST